MKGEYELTITKDKKVKFEYVSAMDNEMIDSMISMAENGGSMDDDDDDWDDEDESDDDWTIVDDDEEEDDTIPAVTSDEDETIPAVDDEPSIDFGGETKTYTDEERWAYIDANTEDDPSYQKTKYENGNFKGYTYTLDLGDIDKLVADKEEDADFESITKDSKMFTKDGDVYSLHMKMSDEDTAQLDQYASMVNFDLKLKVTLPNKAKTNNATSVDGNTYTWDLTKVKDIELTFEFGGDGLPLPLIIGVGAGALVVVLLVVLLLGKKKKKPEDNNGNGVVESTPATNPEPTPTVEPMPVEEANVESVAPVEAPKVEAVVEPVVSAVEPVAPATPEVLGDVEEVKENVTEPKVETPVVFDAPTTTEPTNQDNNNAV